MRLVPMVMTAVPVRATDAPGIRREMSEIQREGFALVLMPGQVKALEDEAKRHNGQDATIDWEGASD